MISKGKLKWTQRRDGEITRHSLHVYLCRKDINKVVTSPTAPMNFLGYEPKNTVHEWCLKLIHISKPNFLSQIKLNTYRRKFRKYFKSSSTMWKSFQGNLHTENKLYEENDLHFLNETMTDKLKEISNKDFERKMIPADFTQHSVRFNVKLQWEKQMIGGYTRCFFSVNRN